MRSVFGNQRFAADLFGDLNEVRGRHRSSVKTLVHGPHHIEEGLFPQKEPQLVQGEGSLDPRQEVGTVLVVGPMGVEGRHISFP